MDPLKNYPAVGRCIYCGTDDESARALGDEHIIPRGLGGRLVLKAASCSDCETITSRIETDCISNMLLATRPHFGIAGRKSGKVPTKLPLLSSVPGERPRRVSIDDHPGLIAMFTYGEPGILSGRDPSAVHGCALQLIPLVSNYGERLRAVGEIVLEGLKGDTMALMFAKIAHSFAVARLGLAGFKPHLPDLILGRSSLPITHFVGERLPRPPASEELHTLGMFRESQHEGPTFWIVRLRLFASHPETAMYDIVVGEPSD